jgi:hypothetical protein
MHPATGPGRGFQKGDFKGQAAEFLCRDQTGQPCADHKDAAALGWRKSGQRRSEKALQKFAA